MTPYDAAMVGIVVAGMIWGAMRGITWQVASLASLVLGYLVAFPLSGQLAPRFPGEPVVARTLALLAVYAAVSGGVFLVAWLVRETLRRWKFDAFDRHLGMLLGGLEGALVGVVATVFVVSLPPQLRAPILTSPSGRVVTRVLDALQGALPGEVRTVLEPFWSAPGLEVKLSLDPKSRPVASFRGNPQDPSAFRTMLEDSGRRVGRMLAEEVEDRGQRTSGAYERDVERR